MKRLIIAFAVIAASLAFTPSSEARLFGRVFARRPVVRRQAAANVQVNVAAGNRAAAVNVAVAARGQAARGRVSRRGFGRRGF